MRLALLAALLAAATFTACTTTAPSAPTVAAATPMPANFTIYHLEGRRSERVVWLMEELGFPYELKFVNNSLGASLAEIRKVSIFGAPKLTP